MNVKESKSDGRNVLVASLVITSLLAISIFVALVAFAPDSTSYSVKNYGWNGMYSVTTSYYIHNIDSISSISTQANKSVLLEIAPAFQFSSLEIELAKNFVTGGGTLVVADNSGISNPLLSGLGSGISISGDYLIDYTYNWKNPGFPIAVANNAQNSSLLSSGSILALSNSSSLEVSGSGVNVIAESSPNSIVKDLTNAVISKGPLPVVAVEEIGSGKLVVIADSTIFLNSLLNEANNHALVNNLLANSSVYLDTSSWPVNSQTSVKAFLLSMYNLLSLIPYRYLTALGVIAFAVFIFRTGKAVFFLGNGSSPKRGEVTLNRAALERIRRDRERYGVSAKRQSGQ